MRKFADCLVLVLAGLCGYGSLALFIVFLFAGSLDLTETVLDQRGRLWLDAGLSLLFFVQHSCMVRKPFRRWFGRLLPEEYDRAFYAIASGAVLLTVIFLWQETSPPLALPGMLHRSMRVLFWLSFAGLTWGVLTLESFDPCGLRPIIRRLTGRMPAQPPLTARGPYRLVRHPLYLFFILMIWSCPDLTADKLLFNLLWTAWIVIGAFFEERDLVAEFGDTYRLYQREVPMFIPLLAGRKGKPSP